MKRFKDISIRYKILLLVMLIFFVIAGVTYVIFSISESRNQKEHQISNAKLIANFTAGYLSSPIFFGNKEETSIFLNSLQTTNNLLYVAVYDQNGKLFDSYNPGQSNILKTFEQFSFNRNHTAFSNNNILVEQTIKYQNIEYGNVVLFFTLDSAMKVINKNKRSALLLTLSMLALVVILTLVLQKIITKPILELAIVSETVKKEANYSIRANKTSKDEIGVLYERFNNMLEQIELRDKKRDYTEKMLKEAKFEAENADKLKSAFLANMSHEIRTPMNSIIGFAGLLNDSELNEGERHEYVELINSSCNTLLHLIDDILDISKIEAGQLDIVNSKINISRFLHELFITFKEINYNSNEDRVKLNLSVPVDMENLVLETDEIRLKQIISNLLSNAIKFTQEGKIELGVTIVEKIKNHERQKFIKFYVHDSGIGLDQQTQAVIFDRFTKIESDNNKLYRGAGLGLTISKKLVELLNGDISLESVPGKGSSFYVNVPANTGEQKEKLTIPPITGNNGSKKEINLEKKNILIVEDDPSNYELLKAILRKTKATIYWAKNGIEAISLCKKETPDIILMDIKMPDMDGYVAAKKIRELNITAPIIAQTAFARLEDEKKILEKGFNAYLSKPIEKNKLLATISKIVVN